MEDYDDDVAVFRRVSDAGGRRLSQWVGWLVGCSENEAILAARRALLEVQHCFRQLPDCGDVSTLPSSQCSSSSQWRCRPPAPCRLSCPPHPQPPHVPSALLLLLLLLATECKVSRLPLLTLPTLPPSLHETGAYLQCTRCRCSPSDP